MKLITLITGIETPSPVSRPSPAPVSAMTNYCSVQTLLIAVKRSALHRSLGLVGAFLGTAVIGKGLLVAVIAMRLGHGNLTQSPEVIFLVALIDISSFALFFVLGYLKPRDREARQ